MRGQRSWEEGTNRAELCVGEWGGGSITVLHALALHTPPPRFPIAARRGLSAGVQGSFAAARRWQGRRKDEPVSRRSTGWAWALKLTPWSHASSVADSARPTHWAHTPERRALSTRRPVEVRRPRPIQFLAPALNSLPTNRSCGNAGAGEVGAPRSAPRLRRRGPLPPPPHRVLPSPPRQPGFALLLPPVRPPVCPIDSVATDSLMVSVVSLPAYCR